MSEEKEDQCPGSCQRLENIIKSQFSAEHRGRTQIILGLMLAGFLLRLYFALSVHLTLDEGSYLYDAELLREGEVPYRDYYTRSPLFLALLAGSISVFGESYLAGRLLSVCLSTLTIPLVYLITRRLFQQKEAFVAAAIFSLSPFTAYHGSLIFTEVPQVFFLTLAFYLVLLGLERREPSSWKLLLLAGFLVGASVLVRRTSLVFLAFLLLFQITVATNRCLKQGNGKQLSRNLKPLGSLALGASLGFGLGVLLLFAFDGGSVYIDSFLTRAGMLDSESNHFFAFVHFSERGFYLYLSFFLAAIYGVSSLIMGKRAVDERDPARPEGGTTTPESRLHKPRQTLLLGFYLFMALLFLLLNLGLFHDRLGNQGAWNLLTSVIYLLGSLLLVLVALTYHPVEFSRELWKGVAGHRKLMVWGWFLALFLFYVSYQHISQIYLYELVVPAIIILSPLLRALGGMAVSQDRDSLPRRTQLGLWKGETSPRWLSLQSSAFLLILLAALLNGYGYYQQDINEPDFATPRDIVDAGEYINSHSSPTDQLFTANGAVAFQANRDIIFNISHPAVYRPSHNPEEATHFPSLDTMDYPTVEEIINYLNQSKEKVPFVVIDHHMNMNYLNHHPDLKEFIQEHYVQVAIYGDIRLLMWESLSY